MTLGEKIMAYLQLAICFYVLYFFGCCLVNGYKSEKQQRLKKLEEERLWKQQLENIKNHKVKEPNAHVYQPKIIELTTIKEEE